MTLNDRLELASHKLISITGGGGKTSLVFAIGKYYAENERAVITTTTKIFPPISSQCTEQFVGSAENCINEVNKFPNNCLVTAAREYSGEKLVGYTDEDVDKLANSGVINKIIVESDGSRGLSLKGYEDWEPPVPSLTTCQIIMLGADAFTVPMSGSTVFRFDILSEKFGMRNGEYLSVANCTAILSSTSGYLKNSPENSYRILFINKGELLSEKTLCELPEKLAEGLTGYNALVIASLQEDSIYKIVMLNRD